MDSRVLAKLEEFIEKLDAIEAKVTATNAKVTGAGASDIPTVLAAIKLHTDSIVIP